jgi:hypothetical protein
MGGPIASLNPLSRADGSASYQCPSTGSNILGSVNAPIELPGRRDALKPEEATLEVFVKPGTAPGGIGERYVEGILKGALGRLVLGREKGYARRGVVITLAVVGGESVERGGSVSQQPSAMRRRVLTYHVINSIFRYSLPSYILPLWLYYRLPFRYQRHYPLPSWPWIHLVR